jgi:hypothetical protein
MLIRSIVTLLASWFATCLLPVYGQGLGLNLPSNLPLQYTPLPIPCRALDTRVNSGVNGVLNSGPAPIPAGATEMFIPAGGGCKIPLPSFGFIVYAMNVTVIPHGPLGYLTVWPWLTTQPVVSTLNSEDGNVKANAALVEGSGSYSYYNPEAVVGTYGAIDVYTSDTTDLVLDVTGYFTVNAAANVYVPVTPCRVVDTRTSNGTFGAPALVAGQQRSFLLADSPCDLPADMTAVSMNVTAVPIDGEPVDYVTVWGTSVSEPQTPPTSTLNAPTGAVTANAAIVTINPDTYGSVSVYASNNTNLVLDVTGYFAPAASAPTGLSLTPLGPCRVLDTRLSTGNFQGELTVPFTTGNDCDVPTGAKAYAVNATVVPTGSLGFLTLWPDGTPQPTVSTLNASDGLVSSNMAIVSTTDGSIDAYASSSTQLILDVTDYFAGVPFASGSQPTVVFVGDRVIQGEVLYANNPNWTFNPVITGYEGSAGADQIAASFSNVLLMNPRPNVAVIQFGNTAAEDGLGCGPGPAYFGVCSDLETIVSEATAAGIKVIVGNLLPYSPITTPPPGYFPTPAQIDALIAMIDQSIPGAISPYPASLLDFNTALGNGSGGYNFQYSVDGIAPNDAGYAVMTTMIQAAVKAVE